MGAYLDQPVTEKHSESNSNSMVSWGAVGMQGWRCGMEDTHIADEIKIPNGIGMLFGVFDGHGGQEVAMFVKQTFTKNFTEQTAFKNQQYKEALIQTFRDVDSLVSKEDYAVDTGSTSCVVFITPDTIYCANAGDSRSVLARSDGLVELSFDHKPQNTDESARISKAQHFVSEDRVDGNLALSRAFGDYQYKDKDGFSWENQAVTAYPDVVEVKRTDKDQFIINACDGIWDCLTNEEAVEKMKIKLAGRKSLQPKDYHKPVEEMLDEILAKDTETGVGTDNMTAILIKINQ